MGHASWLKEIYEVKTRRVAIRQIVKQIKEDRKTLPISHIAVTGISGISFGSIVSYLTGIPLIIVRKDGEKSHTYNSIEYDGSHYDFCAWVFVDDLISSGDTLRRVKGAIENEFEESKLQKVYLYHQEDEPPHWGGVPVCTRHM